ncbi:MAG: peptidase M16 [Methyloprofundus sp.]|nr:peptidase M16 [Methyloprofundus sp.]
MSQYLKPLILFPLLLSSACTTLPPTMETSTNMQTDTVVQSQNDKRHYQAFTLDNDLKVLIISDPETKKAAAALDVFVGSASDPDDRAGLAHFLEHMLFLGTEKYPDPDEYQTFSAQHGGSRNAYTAKEHTNYFFDVENASLEPMLDRFSQFFTAPLFNAEFVEREKNAVNSEYLGKIKTESRRFNAAMQQAFNPHSPYAKFSVGSLETLEDRGSQLVRDDLLKFYKAHYSANLMSLVVLGNEPLAVLKQWVTEKFAAIPNYHAQKKTFNEPLLTSAQMARQIEIKSLQEKRTLSLTFPLPESQSHYLSKPSVYFQSLLGHEGEGSVLALLKAKGWADELGASQGFSNNAQESSLHLGLNLTEAGLQHVDDIIDIVFQYIRLLQQTEVQEWLYQEQRQMSELQFRYQEQQAVSGTVSKLAKNLQYYPMQDVLRGAYMFERYQPELTAQFIALLRPERVLISLSTQALETDQVEQNYQVDYRIKVISSERIQRWATSEINSALALPVANPFIPDELALKTASKPLVTHPELIQKSAHLDLWHQLDTSFNVPRSSSFIALYSPISNDSIRHKLLTTLLTSTINKQLNSYAYPARLAGLHYSIYPTERGLTISLSGYEQKQSLLLARIIDALKNPEITATRFNILKSRFQQKLNNSKKQQPFQQVLAELKRSLLEHGWTVEQSQAALETIQLEDLQQFSAQFLQQLHITVLLQGNVTGDEAKQVAKQVEQQLISANNPVTEVAANRAIQLAENSLSSRKLEIDNPGAALVLYFQAPDKSIQARAEAQLLGRIISSAFFADLRTRQQLGYNLGAGAISTKDLPGMLYILQSTLISAPEIERRFRSFINGFQAELAQLPEAEFENYKAGLITRILEKDKSLQTRSSRNWREIDRDNTNFDTKELIAAAIGEINKTQLMLMYQEWLIDNPRQFRSYALGTKFSTDDFVDQSSLIKDIEAFKRDRPKI